MQKYVRTLSNQQIVDDVVLTNLLGTTYISKIVKPRWAQSVEVFRLVHTLGCTCIRDILDTGREGVKISRKVVKAYYLRIIKALWQSNKRCEPVVYEKFITSKGTYKLLTMLTSKEFRDLVTGPPKLLPSKIPLNLNLENSDDKYVVKGYFSKIKRLVNTRHRNTLLRIWNGDCLSNTRLIYLGLVDTSLCPNCGLNDTPLHMLVECRVADQTWTRLTAVIPKLPSIATLEYAIGLYDGKIEMSIKAEILKMLMHCRNMDAEAILRRTKNYFTMIGAKNAKIRSIFS